MEPKNAYQTGEFKISATLQKIIDQIDILSKTYPKSEDNLRFYDLIEQLVKLTSLSEQENQYLKTRLGLNAKKGSDKDDNNPKKPRPNHSSEKERSGSSSPKKTSGRKARQLDVHQDLLCHIPEEDQPGSTFIGQESHIYQGISINEHNVRVTRVIYKDAAGKIKKAPLPPGYLPNGGFTPDLHAAILHFKHACAMTQTAISQFFSAYGIEISSGSISNILLRESAKFHKDKALLHQTVMECSPIQQFDDTGARVNGENWHTHIINHDNYALFETRKRKDRLSLIDVFMGQESGQRKYRFNEETMCLLENFGISGIQKKRLEEEIKKRDCEEMGNEEVEEILIKLYPEGSHQKTQEWIRHAGAIVYYHEQEKVGVPEVVISDNAAQFDEVFLNQGLCWVHEGRHYKKLYPVVPAHKELLKMKEGELWGYYRKLEEYQDGERERSGLEEEFEKIFGEKTGYSGLDERLKKTLRKKEKLLLVLERKEIPLHNNKSEQGARVKARYRDISLHNRSEEGAKVTDTMMSVVETLRRLGKNAMEYIKSRLKGEKEGIELSEMVKAELIG